MTSYNMIIRFLFCCYLFTIYGTHIRPTSYPLLQHLHGFFGSIGPNIHIDKTTSLFDLFMGDGVIHGIFFENGTIYPIKHIIQTDKVLYTKKYICHNVLELVTKMGNLVRDLCLDTKALMPNMLGTANTAILNVGHKTLALCEQDMPYELNIDFKNKEVTTIGKMECSPIHKHIGPHRFSGHSKYCSHDKHSNNKDHISNGVIHTIDYHFLTRIVNYYKMDSNFTVLSRFSKTMEYLPIIHDFWVLGSGDVIVIDSPFRFWPKLRCIHNIPVVLRKDLHTNIHILGKHQSRTYICNHGFYCFHYGKVLETDRTIEICASLYDELDFNKLSICGKYRQIIIFKDTGSVYIKKNPILETMNLDFPVSYCNLTVLRRIVDNRIAGFVICNGLEIERVIDLPDSVCVFGEHIIKEIDGSVYLMAFCKDGSIVLVNMEKDNDVTIVPVFEEGITLGFHSCFIC